MFKVGIVGANGYTGGELIRLLHKHPEATIHALASRSQAGRPAWELFPTLHGTALGQATILDLNDPRLSECDLVFLAVPHGVAAEMTPGFLAAGVKVIDLGADFRFKDPALYEAWYKIPHPAPELLAEAVYGLPEINRAAIRGARLVGNPGCYPTAILLGVAPLLVHDLLASPLIIADGKSGVSGAGRSPRPDLHFAEVTGDFRAYGLPNHRHIPEVEVYAGQIGKKEVKVSFTPHLVPIPRGILMTLHLAGKTGATTESLTRVFQDFYAEEPMVAVLPETDLPHTKAVLGSNRCQISVRVDERTGQIIVLSALDNLVKGAAGQAIQNMNILFALPETTGLTDLGLWP
ncbi:MAG TPA: N-acetyl-gamma-glutamyl-phosphate reductase [Firmicutes bacterium]|uniref:N-acetyl-gamma-glutamyl-phosphate reductase n=1 Tax=Capillibacterium thermochitinicola TaxID=2699427 RepID=A0A8J6HZH3_9FIRM|nr:N-acetyl-gamma-glutamyl-phosphate reductase [Capillibacterium thermochitinicola]MBA2132925.1 N-acetyl-gamma-glutamyl-phosphate reductase [Capillibacterium thermochitinicola]HHW11767.1 N-acetyl-gamma-glutamyl-phosphate reductase [Bacillota bacterium]